MSRSVPVLPYRVLQPDTVRPLGDGWEFVVHGEEPRVIADGDPLPGWDARLTFQLVREFEISRDLARDLRLRGSRSCCELVVTLSTGRGLRRSIMHREAVPPGDGSRMKVTLSPDSKTLANEILVTTGVLLTDPLRREDDLSPWAEGQCVWEHSTRIRIEGGAARLPMYEVSFSEAFPGDGVEQASFRVTVLEEPEFELEYAVMVYLNAEQPTFVSELMVVGSSAEHRLWSAIIRQAIAAVLLREVSAVPSGETEGSLGAAVRRWSGQIWPGLGLRGVRELILADYPTYEARVESWVQSTFTGSRDGGGS